MKHSKYKVKAGETLSAIAKKHGYSTKEIAELNELKRPYKLKAAQALTLPGKTKTESKSTTKSQTNNEQFYLKLIVFILLVIFVTLSVKLYQIYKQPRLKINLSSISDESNTSTNKVPTPSSGAKVTNGSAQVGVSAIVNEPASSTSVDKELLDNNAGGEKMSVTKDSFSVNILNGNGVKGAANKVRSVLERNEFQIGQLGNAANFKFETTTIEYGEKYEESAMEIAALLVASGYEPITAENKQIEGITITIGRK